MADFFRLSSHSVGRRLGVIIASALLGMTVMAMAFLVSERRLILEERSNAVRQAVELAHGVAAHFHDEVRQGRLSDDEGRRRALDAIKALRYSGTEYFWVNDMQPRMVMHAVKPEMDGTDLSEKKDPDGKRLFVDFVDVVKASGAGIVEYQWPKPGSDTPQPKVSYVKGFTPWGWVIGSGVYVDTVNATVLARAIGMGSATAVLGAMLLVIGLWISRSLLRQLGGEPAYAARVARHMAEGDLGVDIALAPGDSSSLLHALCHVRDSLSHIVGRVRDGADSVSTASTEIAHGNLDLSRRTEQQAASLQQTAASMEELSSTVGRNADNARQANDLALDASSVAERGGDVVRQVVQNMQGINDSSRRIAEIVGVVDSIAFQTNILALNAAVEAARAGEQGRGFAVVATEVRSLAGRSAQAAKEIKSLIGDSVSRVDQGSALVESAGTTMNELGTMVRQVTELIGAVTTASDEQRRGVAEASTAVAQMDQATQQNAALVEQSAAAASSLQRQAEQLVQTVGVFKLA